MDGTAIAVTATGDLVGVERVGVEGWGGSFGQKKHHSHRYHRAVKEASESEDGKCRVRDEWKFIYH